MDDRRHRCRDRGRACSTSSTTCRPSIARCLVTATQITVTPDPDAGGGRVAPGAAGRCSSCSPRCPTWSRRSSTLIAEAGAAAALAGSWLDGRGYDGTSRLHQATAVRLADAGGEAPRITATAVEKSSGSPGSSRHACTARSQRIVTVRRSSSPTADRGIDEVRLERLEVALVGGLDRRRTSRRAPDGSAPRAWLPRPRCVARPTNCLAATSPAVASTAAAISSSPRRGRLRLQVADVGPAPGHLGGQRVVERPWPSAHGLEPPSAPASGVSCSAAAAMRRPATIASATRKNWRWGALRGRDDPLPHHRLQHVHVGTPGIGERAHRIARRRPLTGGAPRGSAHSPGNGCRTPQPFPTTHPARHPPLLRAGTRRLAG